MANNKQRYINTRLWNDSYVSELDPVEKLLFVYFLTNEHTNISGIYEIPLKIIGIETGIDTSMLNKILPRLESKIRYIDGFVVIKNFIKHQETGSELVQKGILNCLKDLDKKWLENVVNKGFYDITKYYIDTLSILYARSLNYSDSNLDSNLDSSFAPRKGKITKFNPLGGEVLKAFESVDPKNKTYYSNTTQRSACDFLISEYGLEKTLQAIKILPQINQKKLYIKQITTPYELKENWVKIGNAIKQDKNDIKNKPNYIL